MSMLSGDPVMKEIHEIRKARQRIDDWRAEHGYPTIDLDTDEPGEETS